jgi:hypothetical protein
MKIQFFVVSALVTLAVGCGRMDPMKDAGCFGLSCPTGGSGSTGGSGNTGGSTATGGSGTTGGGSSTTGGSGATGGGSATGGAGVTGGGGGSATTGGGSAATGGGSDAPLLLPDGGLAPNTTIAARGSNLQTLVDIRGAVVTAVSFAGASQNSTTFCKDKMNPTVDTATKGATASFWVTDPANPKNGIFVTKERCDFPYDYIPVAGDILNIRGIVDTVTPFTDREGKRVVLKNQRGRIPSAMRPAITGCSLLETVPCRPLELTKTGTMAPIAPVDVPTTFGADGGIRAERSFLGARIKMAGPLTIVDATPVEFKRTSAIPNDDHYFGFRLSNGILVGNYQTVTSLPTDAGPFDNGNCDYRRFVLDGGMPTFTSITGVWDTFVHAVCDDGGIASGCFATAQGNVPGVDAGSANILYPMECVDYAQ